MVDGTLKKDALNDKKWEGLMKGGTAGLYTVVVALSLWIKALQGGIIADGGDASVAVGDVAWVLDQVYRTLLSQQGSSGLKRGCDDSNEGTRKTKRWVSLSSIP